MVTLLCLDVGGNNLLSRPLSTILAAATVATAADVPFLKSAFLANVSTFEARTFLIIQDVTQFVFRNFAACATSSFFFFSNVLGHFLSFIFVFDCIQRTH